MKKIINNQNIFIPILVIIMVLIITGVTYAYFTASVIGNETAKKVITKTGTMNFVYDGTNIVSLEDAYPGAYHEVTFSVENNGSLTSSYSIDIINVVNTFIESNDLVYKLEESNETVIDWTVAPNNEESILPAVVIKAGEKHEYKITLHFKETGSSQNKNQGKKFSGLIQVNNLVKSKYLAANILSRTSISTNEIDYKSLPTENVLYIAEDNDGESYYYRGMINNNYVDLSTVYESDTPKYVLGVNGNSGQIVMHKDKTFLENNYCKDVTYLEFFGYNTEENCISDIRDLSTKAGDPLLWRVVRINGDGSIRLITDTMVGYSEYSDINEIEEKLIGYTYDNSSANATDGTTSTIKTYLDNWYTSHLSMYDGYIVESSYCNDTSISTTSGETINYSAYQRDRDGTPSLKCQETTLNYGGLYKLKIGLLSADEAVMAGFIRSANNAKPNTNYLWQPEEFWTMTPRRYNDYPDVFSVNGKGRLISTQITEEEEEYLAVRPVINLASNVKVEGDGTKSNPFKIIKD